MDNPEIREVVCIIIGLELVYYYNHNLFMFPKGILSAWITSTFSNTFNKNLPKEESSSSDSDSSKKSEDNLSNIEEPDFS